MTLHFPTGLGDLTKLQEMDRSKNSSLCLFIEEAGVISYILLAPFLDLSTPVASCSLDLQHRPAQIKKNS